MDLLVPPYEVRDPLLDADLGPVVELALRPPQVGGRQPDIPRLVGVPLDPHASPPAAGRGPVGGPPPPPAAGRRPPAGHPPAGRRAARSARLAPRSVRSARSAGPAARAHRRRC